MSERVRPSRSQTKPTAERVAPPATDLTHASQSGYTRSPVTVRHYAGVSGDSLATRNSGDREGEQELDAIFAASGHPNFPTEPTPVQLSLAAQLQKMKEN